MTKLLHSLRHGRASTVALTLVAAWATGGLVACADGPTAVLPAPSAPATVATVPASRDMYTSSGASLLSQTTVGDTTVSQFVVNNGGQFALFDIGNQSKIFFPRGAGSICDPTVTAYGPGQWDLPCAPLSHAIKITSKSWVNRTTGRINTDFSPELRFVPDVYGVTLFLHDNSPSLSDRIDYCSDGVCINDAGVDGALVTSVDGSGFVYRVIKHFSGYNVVVN